MSDLKTKIVVDLAGNLSRRAKQFSSGLNTLEQKGSRSMRLLNRSTTAAGRSLDFLGNRYMGFVSMITGASGIRYVKNLQKDLRQLQVDSRASAEDIDLLKKRLFEVANLPDIRLDPGKLLEGITEIVTKTGDLKFAIENLENLGHTIRAVGSAGNDTGSVMTNFYKGGVRDTKLLLDVTSSLVAQAKEGSVAYRDIATIGNKLFAPYLAAGKSGAQAFKDMGAVAQVTIDAVGSADEVATATTALLAQLKDPKIQQSLSGVGVKVYNGDEMRSLPKLIREISNAAGGDVSKLGTLFNESSMKVFEGALLEGNLQRMERFADITADSSSVLRDAAANAQTLDAALSSISNHMKVFSDNELAKPIQQLADGINKLDPNAVQGWLEFAKNMALLTGGLVAAKKVGLFKLGGHLLGQGKTGSGYGVGLPDIGKPIPVYIVNNTSGTSSKIETIAKKSPWLLGLQGAGLGLLPAAGAAGIGYGAMSLFEGLAEHQVKNATTPRLAELLMQHNVLGGGSDSYQARLIRGELLSRGAQEKVDVGGTLNININSDGQARVTRLRSNDPRIDIDVDSGLMMRSH